MTSGGDNGKGLNFEINILPILDILSVLICFLLLTAVFIEIGTIDTRQAIADNSVSGDKNPPSLWVTVKSDGGVNLSLRDLPNAKKLEESISRSSSGINWTNLESRLQNLRAQFPELKTGVILPEAQSSYGDVIRMMDKLKQFNFEGVGISPLG